MLNVKPVTAQSEPTTAATIEVARSSVQEPKQTAKLSVDLYLFAKDKMAYYSNTRVTSVVTIMTDKGKTVESREVASRLTAEGRTVFELPYGDYLITIDREGKHFQKKITLASPDTHIIFDFPQGLIQKVN